MYTPDEIAEHQFLIALRGYDRDEVSAFLDEVAAQVRTLQQRIAELETQREAAAEETQEAPAQEAPPADRRASFRELGEETTRILEAAEEAAEQMRNRADEEARTLLEEARREAAEARESAQQESSSILEEARSKAEQERERASDTATQVLEEARSSARETLDTANAKHREIAETVRELDELRERLIDDLRNVSETIGGAVDRLAGDPDEATLPEVPEGVTADELTEDLEVAGPGPAVADDAAPDEDDGDVEQDEEPVEEQEPVDDGDDPEPEGDAEQTVEVDDLEHGEPTSDEMEVEDGRDDGWSDDASGDDEGGPSPAVADVASRELRDQALAGIRPGMLRRLKRTLQDVQNGVLDAIRRESPDAEVTRLLPTDDELAPLHSVGEAFLGEAYRAGLGDGATLAAVPPSEEAEDPERVAAAAEELRGSVGHEVVAALEPSLAAGLEAGEDESSLGERVSEVFRGLKGPVAESAAEQSLMRIHALGTHDAWVNAGVDARVWVVGEETRCPENRCRANADEGPVPFDRPFPSGDTVPPAHAGCTCTLAPS